MKKRMVREIVGGESYAYFPLGKHVVSCPEVCRGRPTFKYTRIEVSYVLDRLGAGHPIREITKDYGGKVTPKAIAEAVALSAKALVRQAPRGTRPA